MINIFTQNSQRLMFPHAKVVSEIWNSLIKNYGARMTVFDKSMFYFPTFGVLYYTNCQGTALQ